jgi:hypothetical protein
MDKIELNLEVIGRLAGKTGPEVVELLKNDESESGFFEGDALQNKIETIIGDKFKRISDQQRGRAKREVLTDFEKQLRQNFGVDNSELRGLDLVNHLVDGAKNAKTELTPDAIKAHPFFRDAMKAKNEELQKISNDFEGYKRDISNKTVRSEVERKARGILLALNPVLSKNETIKDNQVKMFLASLNGNFKIDGDKIKVLNESGEEALDASYNPLGFESLVKNRAASFFDFHEVDPNKSSPGDKTKHSTPNGNNSFSFPTFANTEEAMQYLRQLKKSDLTKAKAFAQNLTNYIKK